MNDKTKLHHCESNKSFVYSRKHIPNPIGAYSLEKTIIIDNRQECRDAKDQVYTEDRINDKK